MFTERKAEVSFTNNIRNRGEYIYVWALIISPLPRFINRYVLTHQQVQLIILLSVIIVMGAPKYI
jgi:hypothetical protein